MYSVSDTIWVLIGTILVFFMQAGFAMLESGFVRFKNSANVAMKNVTDFILGSLAFWVVGFGLMYNGDGSFIGSFDFFAGGSYVDNIPDKLYVIYQMVFCCTSATIASGALAGRMKFSSYCVYSIVMSAFIYPISGHWAWGNGFLEQLGFHDFAGGAVVHMAGGMAAIASAAILGPRMGKYSNNKRFSNVIQGHNLVISILGVFILWIGWFGFNGSSTMTISDDASIKLVSDIFFNTLIAGAAGGVTMLFASWYRYGKSDISMTLNGILAGLVSITSGCDTVSAISAFIIGVIVSLVSMASIEFIDLVLHVDDPVGAFSVHGVSGALGIIFTGLFARDGGLFYGHGIGLLKVQLFGVLCIALWVLITVSVLMLILKYTIGIRISKDAEMLGADKAEHGYTGNDPAYSINYYSDIDKEKIQELADNIADKNYKADGKIHKVVIITRENKICELKEALNEIGISGLTISSVLGCGVQKGHLQDFYRGVENEVELLPKVRVEIVIANIPLQSVIDCAQKVLKTGAAGDGKIFVYDVDDVVRVRTNENGLNAL